MSRFFVSTKEYKNTVNEYDANYYGNFYALLDKWDAIENFLLRGVREDKDIVYLIKHAQNVGKVFNYSKEVNISNALYNWYYAHQYNSAIAYKARAKARLLVSNYYDYINNNYEGKK